MRKVICLSCLYVGLAVLYAQEKPAWVDAPSAVYPERQYAAATGQGRDRSAAENSAKGALASTFKQSVSSNITIVDTERQSGGQSVSRSDMSQTIQATAALDNMLGVEIKAAWNDTRGRGGWYAVAVMDKAQGRRLYAAELDKQAGEISALIDVSGGVTFETMSKCRRAQSLLPAAEVSALVLSMIGGPDRHQEVTALSRSVTAAFNQAKAIPVDVRVKGDTGGRIKAAFAKPFTDMGFRTGNTNSRFALEVTLNLTPAAPGKYFNTRYTVDAVLKDTQTGAELFTYNAANRESHPANQEEADNRAVIGAIRKIEEEFPQTLQDYISNAN